MPRRRLQTASAQPRLASILGIPPADAAVPVSASAAVAPATAVARAPDLAGWVPQRRMVARPPAASVPVTAGPLASLPAASRSVASALMGTGSSAPDPRLLETGRHRRPAPPKPRILTVPVALRGVRARPRRLAVLGVMVLVLAAAVVFGVRVAWAHSTAQPQPIAASAHSPPGGLVTRTVPAAFASPGAAALPAAASVLLAHVVGQVLRPGVVRLRPGARVLDAVQAAGGASSSADLNNLNLARPVADGEQIVVPKPGQAIPLTGALGSGGSGAGSAGKGSAGAGSAGGLVDLNTADASALDSLPGVGPVLSQRILDWRTQHGRFSSVDELGEVTGIGDKLLTQIGPKVRV
jgi:competence protein ComEA